jgi:hypothetical protein
MAMPKKDGPCKVCGQNKRCYADSNTSHWGWCGACHRKELFIRGILKSLGITRIGNQILKCLMSINDETSISEIEKMIRKITTRLPKASKTFPRPSGFLSLSSYTGDESQT